MKKSSVGKMVCIVFVFCAATAIVSPAQTLTTVYNFCPQPNCPDGADPAASLLLASDGNFYGTTVMGGASSGGTIFKMTPAGAITTLHSFAGPEGYHPYAPLVQGHDGNFYGTANSGGAHSIGSVFKITPSGTFTALHFFNYTYGEGGYPGPLVAGSDGYFYGVTSNGGDDNLGTVFQISADGSTFNTLYYFASSVGKNPSGALLQGNDGNFYGVSPLGGSNGYGTVFRITPSGVASVIYTFCPQGDCTAGGSPNGALLQTSDGNFYGGAGGGTYDGGVIFKVTPGGALTTLHSFNRTDGLNPNGTLVLGSDGNFYGTTVQGGAHGDGTVFQMSPAGALISLHSFAGTDGVNPNGGLIQVNGKFYGTTYTGGANNYGTVYSLTVPPPSLTAVTSSPNPSTFGELVTITATVGPPGPPVPTGTVSFTSNGTAISGCTAVPLSSSRTAVCTTSTLALGTDAIVATYSGDSNYLPGSGTLSQIVNPVPSPVQFAALTPCRVVDTRNPNGPFGGPPIGGHSSRSFPLAQSGNPCGIPATAVAYSLNVTVVPGPSLGYLTIWPAGEGQPVVSTMNSLDGRVKANAAIIPAGTSSGSVSVYVTDTTNVILDIDGYFTPSTGSTLQFYPLTPCRVVDTRHANGDLGGPYLTHGQQRSFPVLESTCGISNSAQAYSFNFTAIPRTRSLGFLSVWPEGQPQPLVSTLNDTKGTIVANAAIVPAGTSGGITVYPTDDTDLAIDVNGYFAPAGTGGLSLYVLTPCRVLDTRHEGGAFTGKLVIDVLNSVCAPPSSAQAYVFNATVVPQGSLGYLALWPDGQPQPVVSTLNAPDGSITSNMAIVPASTQGKIDAFAASGITQLLMDISSYFAP